jgi:predicted nucleic acid-binding protein
MTVFVDTWAWLALALRRDQYHETAKRQHARFVAAGRIYVTTDFVLSELVTQLYRSLPANEAETFVSAVLSAIDSGVYRLERVSPARFASAWQLRRQYADKPAISFVDFTSFVIMQDLEIQEAFTGDAHFRQVSLGFRMLP